MTYRILFTLDGSHLAEQAIPWADELAHRLGAELELLRVVGPEDVGPTVSDTDYSRCIEELVGTALTELRLTADRFPQYGRPQSTVLQGSPGGVIAAHAQVSSADLIIMASHGYGGLKRSLYGSVAGEVIRESGTPVLVVPAVMGSTPDVAIQRVLVPLDGSELAESVLPSVVPLARALGWTLVLFWVAEWPPQAFPVQGGMIPLHLVRGAGPDMVEYLEQKAAELREQGVDTDFRIWFGERASGITAFAAETQVDLIALSTHGRHGPGRWLLGSTLDHVLTHARQPVLAVRPTKVPFSSQQLAHQLQRRTEPCAAGVITLQLTPAQADVVRVALDHLTWADSHHNVVRDQVGSVQGALDAATATANGSAPSHGRWIPSLLHR